MIGQCGFDKVPGQLAGPVTILAGGTGGHIYPALAVAKALQEQGIAVHWMGAKGAMEEKIVPGHGILLSTIAIKGLRGKSWKIRLSAPFRLLGAIIAAGIVLSRHRPCAVISFGGYAAGPGGIAARCLRLPLLVHEQNRIPGLTNKALARIARRVLTGFPGSFSQEEVVGNPIRREIADLRPPMERMAQHSGLRLLILGGSQGAQALNQAVPLAIGFLGQRQIEIWHQTGEKGYEQTQANYRSAGITARVEPFIQEMVRAYEWADLIICRSGASTLAEICAVGIGSLLVPFAAAVDDHQTRNAEYLVSAGAAILIKQTADLAQHIVQALAVLLENPSQRMAMAVAARSLAMPQAAQHIAAIIVEEARPPSGCLLNKRWASQQKSGQQTVLPFKDTNDGAVIMNLLAGGAGR